MINSAVCEIRRGGRIAGLAIAGALMALPALAADSWLADANAHLVKAVALLNAAANASDAPVVSMHRLRAIRLIEQAEREIARTQQAADAPPPAGPGLHTMPRSNTGTLPRLR